MGARQSKRSVDITTTPKKEGLPAEGVVGDAAAPGDGKLEKIEEADAKPTTNGTAVHTDATPEDKDKDKDEATEKEKEKDDETKADEAKVESPTVETPAEGAAEATTPTEGTPVSPTTATSPDSKETKKKDKLKKKWSFRSISFGKKDKNKPAREDAPKNGDVTIEEPPLTEGCEEAENAAAACSPADEKSPVSSPTEKEQSGTVAEAAAVPEAKVEDEENKSSAAVAAPAAVPVASSPAEEKKEESSTPAPTPVPVEAKKVEENEKEVEPANADKKVEVSPVQAVIEAPVEVNSQPKQIATTTTTAPSIIERKTSEDFPSQFPSSPPPTPIDPSPLQHAQQVAENASAIAEALKLPAEAASKADIALASDKPVSVTLSASPTSSWRVETSSTSPVTVEPEKPSHPTSSESPEQTGNAFPIPVDTTITALTDTTEKPSAVIEQSDLRNTELEYANDVAEIALKSEPVVESPVPEKPLETDLVIQTEEGLAPVSGDISVEAKPAVVVPDSPAEEIKSVQVLLEPENNLGSEESVPVPVESTEGLALGENENSEVVQTLSEPIIPTTQDKSSTGETTEMDIPPPLPDSPIPMPKVTSQLLNFMSTQIEDSPVIAEIIDSANNLALSTEEASCPLSPKVEDIPEASCSLLPKVEDIPEVSCPLPPKVVDIPEVSCPLPPKVMDIPEALCPLPSKVEDIPEPPCPLPPKIEDIPEALCPLPPKIEDIPEVLCPLPPKIEDIPEALCPLPPKVEDVPETSCPIPPKMEDIPEDSCPIPPKVVDIPEPTEQIADTEESEPHAEEQQDNPSPLPPSEEIDSRLNQQPETIDDKDVLPAPQENLENEQSCQSTEQTVDVTKGTTEAAISNFAVSTDAPITEIPTETTLLTPPRSPSPAAVSNLSGTEVAAKESSQLDILEVDSNREFKTESVEESLNSYNDSELELKERLAESMEENTPVNCQLSNAVQDENDQSKTEPEAPVENNIVMNNISTTEVNDEAPKSPPPAVPAEVPAPILGPAITEDVASVTKAIEEIDINEKAVAAAVNENIESANTNEIIADMNHQNNMIE